jgi:hypothetical protein
MWFILLCIFIGAFILMPPLRALIGQAILFFIVGLLAIFLLGYLINLFFK